MFHQVSTFSPRWKSFQTWSDSSWFDTPHQSENIKTNTPDNVRPLRPWSPRLRRLIKTQSPECEQVRESINKPQPNCLSFFKTQPGLESRKRVQSRVPGRCKHLLRMTCQSNEQENNGERWGVEESKWWRCHSVRTNIYETNVRMWKCVYIYTATQRNGQKY